MSNQAMIFKFVTENCDVHAYYTMCTMSQMYRFKVLEIGKLVVFGMKYFQLFTLN